MRHLTVDRMDGIYAICEDAERRMFAIPLADLPAKIREGDKLDIDDEGTVFINDQATQAARKATRKKEDSLFTND